MNTTDRRRYNRVATEIACKARRSAHTMYAPAKTIDISPDGAALVIDSARVTHEGDRLALAFNSPDCPILKASKMIGVRVVRVSPLPNSNRQRIAVEFDSPQHHLADLVASPDQPRKAA